MKSPTDNEILSFIRDHYYNDFASFDKSAPSRLTKIYVPISIDLIAEKFGVDGDIIFGRLYYFLNKKYGYKNDDGSKVEFFANSLSAGGKSEKHLINFPLLDSILTELNGENQKAKTQDWFERILLHLFDKKDTEHLTNLFEMTESAKEREIIRSKAKELHEKRKFIDFGPSGLNMQFVRQFNKFELYGAEKKAMEERRWKYLNILQARITLDGIEYVKTTLLRRDLSQLLSAESPSLPNSNSQSLTNPNENIKKEKRTVATWYNKLNTIGKVIIWILGVLASLATIIQLWISL